VEHTVTEMVTGLDLVALQLRLAAGETLAAIGLATPPAPRGHAIQLRLNAETIAFGGTIRPAGGTLLRFRPPTGPGLRCDHAAAEGMD
ncbi:acetyl/propionyl-CoA carboxylase subunit alpha, partial [Acinetobacter baumannii]